MLRIVKFYSTDFFGIIFGGIETGKHNRLVASKAGRFIDGLRIQSSKLEIGFGAGYESGLRLIQGVEPGKINITAVHEVDGASFRNQLVKNVDVMYFTMSNPNKRRNGAAQV